MFDRGEPPTKPIAYAAGHRSVKQKAWARPGDLALTFTFRLDCFFLSPYERERDERGDGPGATNPGGAKRDHAGASARRHDRVPARPGLRAHQHARDRAAGGCVARGAAASLPD